MGLQIADAVAGAFFYAVQPSQHGFVEDRYARILSLVLRNRKRSGRKDFGWATSCGVGNGAVISGAHPDPDLAIIIERWDALPGPIRAGILAMVKATLAAAPTD